jgi:hypothetical protein
MSNKSLYRAGLVFAILMSVSWIAYVIGGMSQPDTSDLGPAASILAIVESGWPATLAIWGGVLGSLFTIPAFLVYFVGFGRRAPVLLIPVAFVVVGAVFVALAFMMDAASLRYIYAPALAGKSAAEAGQFAFVARIAVDSIEVAWDVGSFLAYGFGSLWTAILLLRVAGVPKWINVVGIIGGLAGLAWMIDFVPFTLPLADIWLPINILAVIVWMIALSAVLARTDEPSTEAEVSSATAA